MNVVSIPAVGIRSKLTAVTKLGHDLMRDNEKIHVCLLTPHILLLLLLLVHHLNCSLLEKSQTDTQLKKLVMINHGA